MMFNKIFLVGFMGCGKTTLGRKIADKIGWDFVDLDNYIEQKEGSSISSIFKEKGEHYFRKVESSYLKNLVKYESHVISCGGGTPCFDENMEIITSQGASLYIKLSPTDLFERLKLEKNKRPLIADMSDLEMITFIKEKLIERKIFYERAKFTFNSNMESEEKLIKRLNDFLV